MMLTAGNRCVSRKNVIEVLICPPQIVQDCLRIERGPPRWEAEDLLQHRNAINPADSIIIIIIIIIR
jgi:hypothetical protein